MEQRSFRMGAFTKDTEEVMDWFYQIGKQMCFPYMQLHHQSAQEVSSEILLKAIPIPPNH